MKIYVMKDLASASGVSIPTLYQTYLNSGLIKETGYVGISRYWDEDGLNAAVATIKQRQAAIAAERQARANALGARYKKGETLQEIGLTEGITRERVRQILKPLNISKKEGGGGLRAVAAKRRAEEVSVAQRERKCQKIYGCTFAEFAMISNSRKYGRCTGDPLLNLWWHHRNTATRAHVPWQFTLPVYKEFVGDYVNLFKRERDGLVLRRKDSKGPYSPENCEITTLAENSRKTNGFAKAREKRTRMAQEALVFFNRGWAIPVIAEHMHCSRARVTTLLALGRRLQETSLT